MPRNGKPRRWENRSDAKRPIKIGFDPAEPIPAPLVRVSARVGFDLGDLVPQPLKDAANAVVDTTGQLLPDQVKQLTEGLDGKFQAFAASTTGQTVLRAFATGLFYGVAPEFALALGPAGNFYAGAVFVLPGLATGENVNQAAVTELSWRFSKTAEMITSDPSLASQFGASLPVQLQNIGAQLKSQYTTVSNQVASLAATKFPSLPLSQAVAQLNLTPASLAAQLGVRVDVAAAVIDYASGLVPPPFPLKNYDPKTGADLNTLATQSVSMNVQAEIAGYASGASVAYEGNAPLAAARKALGTPPVKTTGPGGFSMSSSFLNAAGVTTVPDTPAQKGFDVGVGMMVSQGVTQATITSVRTNLPANEQTGFDAALAFYRGSQKTSLVTLATTPAVKAGIILTHGMIGQNQADVSRVLTAATAHDPAVKSGVAAASQTIAKSTPAKSWWQAFLGWFGL